ncbi:MAG: zinc ribbon domain-containing protein [Candidatus Diapherotrites archaeon]
MEMTKCPKCGSTEIDRGKTISSTWSPKYISAKQKMFSQAQEVVACICLNCGYLEFYADAEKIRQNLKE